MIWNRTDNPTHALYLLPWILEKFDKIIYLHSDILAMTDLSELATIDLGNCYLAAALDYYRLSENKYDRNIEKIRKHKLGMEDHINFFSHLS
jgi:lipopolysaccharide biosynthesis glycosyltransferase